MIFSQLKIAFAIAICLSVSLFSSAQDSCHYRISLLTCSPGEDLYSTFGHSALRVVDYVSHTDVVYNYGTFNFEEEGFYIKFARGKLRYYLSSEEYQSFVYSYEYEGRGIVEQVLNLSCTDKESLVGFLQNNIKEENRYYKYDFTFDNCTTRLRDIVQANSADSVHFGNALKKPSTFRDLIYEYLDYNDKQWSKLGIDLLLGSRLDEKVTAYQSMFLPEYLMNTFEVSRLGPEKLVKSDQQVLPNRFGQTGHNWLTDPFTIFTVLLLFVIAGSFSQNVAIRNFLLALDGTLVFLTGILGILFILMWVGTDHYMCKDNYNLLWAWPTNLVVAFFLNSKSPFARYYFLVYAILLSGMILAWLWLPQHFNTALLPLLGILIFRIFFTSLKSQPDGTSRMAR